MDWFAGIGGIRLGLERAGHTCVWSCEIDAFARLVYGARFGHAPEGKDLHHVEASQVPQADLWAFGSPCQDVSTAGKRAGTDEGTRSGLVFRVLALAAELRPGWILMENVPGMLSVRGGADYGRVLAAMDDAGYVVGAWRVLDARFFGVPQRRRRLFVLARRAGVRGDPAEILLERDGRAGRASPGRGAEGAAVAVTARAGKGVRQRDGDDTLIAATLGTRASRNAPDSPLTVGALGCRDGGHDDNEAQAGKLIAFDMAQVTHPENRAACDPGSEAPTLAKSGRAHVVEAPPAEAGAVDKRDQRDGQLVLAFNWAKASHGHGVSADVASALGSHHDEWRRCYECEGEVDAPGTPGVPCPGCAGTGRVWLGTRTAVRRLTPRECERLQGLPDDWTLVDLPWKKIRCPFCRGTGLEADARAFLKRVRRARRPLAFLRSVPVIERCGTCRGRARLGLASDSLRYKVIGNSVAEPVLYWIGRRLKATEEVTT